VTGWAYWRIDMGASDTYIVTEDWLIPIRRVIVLLEMPVIANYRTHATEANELLFWTFVGHPAFALAFRFAYLHFIGVPLVSVFSVVVSGVIMFISIIAVNAIIVVLCTEYSGEVYV